MVELNAWLFKGIIFSDYSKQMINLLLRFSLFYHRGLASQFYEISNTLPFPLSIMIWRLHYTFNAASKKKHKTARTK